MLLKGSLRANNNRIYYNNTMKNKQKIEPQNRKYNLTFNGTMEDHLSCVPESCADDIIRILELDANLPTTPYFPNCFPLTLKQKIWCQIAMIVRQFHIPTPTETGTTPKQCFKHAENLRNQLSDTLHFLKDMQYEEIYKHGEVSKEFIIAEMVRKSSVVFRDDGKPKIFSTGAAKSWKELYGEWPALYPFDSELTSTIESIERILPYFDKTTEYYQKKVKGRGEVKIGKHNADRLIVALCGLYKEITGNEAVSWPTGTSAINAGQFTGKIIPFMQAILPYVPYHQEITDSALQKRVERLKKSKKRLFY